MSVTIRYTVRGFGSFPEDMLRYDDSAPAEPEDKHWISAGGVREAMLETIRKVPINVAKRWVREGIVPCRDRWNSFLWNVTEVWINDESVYTSALVEDGK
jgi:hypothetical protein